MALETISANVLPGSLALVTRTTGRRGVGERCHCWLAILILSCGLGCRMVKTATDIPAQAVRAINPLKQDGRPAVDPVDVQQSLLRFTDEFSARMILSVDDLRRGTNALNPVETVKWKIAIGTVTCSIASGPNAIANLADMAAFVTVTKMALEDHWQPNVFGESALPMLEGCRVAEAEIWRLAEKVLKPDHQAELREAINVWHHQNPHPESVLAARGVGLASQLAEASKRDATKPESVFSLLKVDPFAGMDPAVREIAQTRLFAERALFLTQKMPMLLRWQTELLSLNAVGLPQVRELISNSTQISASVERFAQVAEQLPGLVATERGEILKALESQEKNLKPLINETRETLLAGAQMSTSLNTTLATFDSLMKRFGVGEPIGSRPPGTNSEPFRISDYGQAALKLEAMARQFTELMTTLDRTIASTNLTHFSAQTGPAIHQAQIGGKEIVAYAFWKGVQLMILVLIFALIYRFMSLRMIATKSK